MGRKRLKADDAINPARMLQRCALVAAFSAILDAMSDGKIFADPDRPATLNNGGALDDCPTLREVVMAWHQLPPDQRKRATIRVMGGPLYTATDIERLQFRKVRS